jgi:hypothetical protein
MKTILLVLLIFALSAPAHADEWSKTDIGLQAAVTALMVVDWGQTLNAASQPDKYCEMNPILGKHPSRGSINTYFATAIIGHAAISHILPQDYRRIWQSIFIGVELAATSINYQAGVKIRF